MAIRTAKNRATSDGLSPDVIADIARDTAGYEARLVAFREIEAKAVEAEAIARTRQAEAEAAEARSRAGLQELADRSAALDARESALAERERACDRLDTGSKERSAAVGERERLVAEREADLGRLKAEAIAAVKALAGA